MNFQDFLTVEEAAQQLDCTPSFVRQLCQKGKIECRKFGRSWAISRDGLKAYQNREREKPGPKPKAKPED